MSDFIAVGIRTEYTGRHERATTLVIEPRQDMSISFSTPKEMRDLARALKRNAKHWEQEIALAEKEETDE